MSSRRVAGARVVRVVALLAAAIALPVAARGFDARVDLTANQRLTLSPQTREVLTLVRHRLQLTAFFDSSQGAEEGALRDLVAEYERRNPKVRLRVADPRKQPGLALRYGLEHYGSVFVDYDGRRTEAQVAAEIELTSAVLRAVRPLQARVCFVTGHGEGSIADAGPQGLSGLAAILGANGYELSEVSLAGGAAPLDRCSVVVLAGPRAALLEREVSALVSWTERSGRLLVAADPSSDTALADVVGPWGIDVHAELVVDSGSALPGDPSTLLVERFPSSSPLTAGVARLLLAEAGWATVHGDEGRGLVVASLAEASGGAEVIARSRVEGEPGVRRRVAHPVLAAVGDRSSVRGGGDAAQIERTMVAWVGDSDFATNALVGEASNRRFALAIVSRLTLEEDLVAIGAPEPDVRRLVLTDAESDRLFTVTVVAAPLSVVIVGALVRLVRGRAGRASRRKVEQGGADRHGEETATSG